MAKRRLPLFLSAPSCYEMTMKKRFEGSIVWITGGGSGIGRALAEEFARQGANVVVSGRRRERLEETCEALKALGSDAMFVEADVTSDASLSLAVDAIVERYGRLDIAVANAGFAVSSRIENLDAATLRRQLDTNVVGLVSTARAAMPELRKSKGQIVLIGSVTSVFWAPGVGPYNASKAAVRALGRTLAIEMHGTGVGVTTIHPGFVESEINQVDNRGVYNPKRRDTRPAKLMWPSDRAARVMVRAIAQRKREFVFTWHGKFGFFLGKHLPGLVHFFMTRSGKKGLLEP